MLQNWIYKHSHVDTFHTGNTLEVNSVFKELGTYIEFSLRDVGSLLRIYIFFSIYIYCSSKKEKISTRKFLLERLLLCARSVIKQNVDFIDELGAQRSYKATI